MSKDSHTSAERTVWTVPEWCEDIHISRAGFYTLPVKPRSIKVGRLKRIIESPADWTARLAAMQGVA